MVAFFSFLKFISIKNIIIQTIITVMTQQRRSTLYTNQEQQYNISQIDQEPLTYSTQSFKSKFIKELNFQQNCQKKIQRRIRQIKNMNSIRQAIYDKFIHKNTQNQQDRSNDQQNGSGKSHEFNPRQFFYNGNLIKGKIKRKMLNGDIQILYKNGKEFQGLYQNGRMKAGKFDFKNGYEYWGDLNGKEFNGKGTLKCPDGKRITGVWKGEHILGRTEIQYPSGDVYYGQVDEKFKKHGKGYLFFKSGNKYIGDFQHGQITGRGTYSYTNGQVYKGRWNKGELIQQKTTDSQEQNDEIVIEMTQLDSFSKTNNQTNKQNHCELQSEVSHFIYGQHNNQA